MSCPSDIIPFIINNVLASSVSGCVISLTLGISIVCSYHKILFTQITHNDIGKKRMRLETTSKYFGMEVQFKKTALTLNTKMIGNKIAEARKKINISQAQLGERLFISSQAVGKSERGESMPDITTFDRLVEILGVDHTVFLFSIGFIPNHEGGVGESSENS